MRDPFAPFIEGYDLSGVVNPYSFQCTPFYEEGDNGGTLMDGTTIHDVLAAKVRLSWTLNALSAQQYADLSAALRSGPSLDTVDAYVFDPTRNINIFARFHVSAPDWLYAFDAPAPMSFADAELVLTEAEFLGQFSFTPPNKTTYECGESLDLTGLTVTQYDKNGNGVDITAQCAFSPANGTVLLTEGTIPVIAILPGGFEEVMDWHITVTPPIPIASGDWWALFKNGLLDIYCVGSIPSYSNYNNPAPWNNYRAQITSVTIQSSVTGLGSYAFNNCTRLTSITIPDSVTRLGMTTFQYCYALTSITIPNGVTSIGSNVFNHCTHLRSITIPNSVTTLGSWAFYGCYALASITIPDSVTTIHTGAFQECGALTSITIPNSVTSIGTYAFYGCTRLTSITIPDNVTTIGNRAFYVCSKLQRIDVTTNNSAYSSENGILFNKSKTTLICCPNAIAVKTYIIPSSVTTIEEDAFIYCTHLTSITIPDSVTSIRGSAFSNCSALTSITIPNSVTSIGVSAFSSCSTLTSIAIPDSVTTLGARAFAGCTRLTSITIPNSVTSISEGAFQNCSALTSITIPNSITTLGERAFYSCSALTSITIPDNVTTIGRYTFYGCTHLNDIYYSGTESQRAAMTINTGNDQFLDATWHYNSTGPDS